MALARAIVFDPPVILMDEPLGALDKKLRSHMQVELKQLQRRLGATVIYVTHDQEEALTMSDRVAVMDKGRLVQLGTPRELYDRPATAFVADFIGEMNLLPGTVRRGGAGGGALHGALAGGSGAGARRRRCRPGPPSRLAVRPEHVRLSAPGRTTGLRGRSRSWCSTAPRPRCWWSCRAAPCCGPDVGTRSAAAALEPGAAVVATWRAEEAIVFPAAAA